MLRMWMMTGTLRSKRSVDLLLATAGKPRTWGAPSRDYSAFILILKAYIATVC